MAAATSTLDTIRTKVRRLTRTPSQAQLSNDELDQYINTFIENEIPTTLKLFSLRTVLTFYTQPGVDVYKSTSTDDTDPLYNFQNVYTAIHDPVFIAGVPAYFTQERGVFYGNWPQTNFIQNTGLLGNGTAGPFTGIVSAFNQQTTSISSRQFILQNSVIFTALDVNGTAMVLVDNPTSNILGNLIEPNDPTAIFGTINYFTGAFSFSFPANTGDSSPIAPNPIWVEIIPYIAGIPTTMLYYNNEFTLRPVPDKAYAVQVEANMRPTELLMTDDVPQITQWWQWIAYGAAKYIFQDRMDMESVQMIMPELKLQESLVNSTSVEQYTNERTVTIYTNNGINQSWNNPFGQWPY